MHRCTDRQRDGQTGRHVDRLSDIQAYRVTDEQEHIGTDRRAHRQTGTHTNRQTANRQTDGETGM